MLWIQSAFFSFSFAWQFSKPSPTCYLGPPPNPLPPTDLCTPKTFPLSSPHLCRWQDYNKNTVLWTLVRINIQNDYCSHVLIYIAHAHLITYTTDENTNNNIYQLIFSFSANKLKQLNRNNVYISKDNQPFRWIFFYLNIVFYLLVLKTSV